MNIFEINYTSPVAIQINGIDTTDINEFINEYFSANKFKEEEKKIFLDNLASEMTKSIQEYMEIQTKGNDNKALVPIYDYEDSLEVAVKNTLFIGQVFPDGWNQIYKTVGFNNLTGGKQRLKAKNNLRQYADFSIIEGSKRSLICDDIFEVPHYLDEKTDGRGKRGFYADRIIPILVDYLQGIDGNSLFTDVKSLSKITGLANPKYKTLTDDELKKINPKFSRSMISQFYFRCKPQQEAIIYRILDRLQDDFSILSFYKNFCIFTEHGSYTSDKTDDSIIRRTQRIVLQEFGANRILTIFQRKQEEKFYSRVCELINKTYGLDWLGYRQQIQIIIDRDGLQDLIEKFAVSSEQISKLKSEVSQHFTEAIQKRTISDYERTNEKADKKESEMLSKSLDESPEIKELADIGIDLDIPIKKSEKPFKYHDNYLEIQNELIALLISQPCAM